MTLSVGVYVIIFGYPKNLRKISFTVHIQIFILNNHAFAGDFIHAYFVRLKILPIVKA